MAKDEMVSQEDVDAARALLDAAKRTGVPIRGAMWLYDSHEDRWELVLESGDPKAGIRAFADRLLSAVAMIPDERTRRSAQRILLGPARISNSPHPIAELLRRALPGVNVDGTKLRDTTVGGYVIEGALLFQL
jgi:hypothetical protein